MRVNKAHQQSFEHLFSSCSDMSFSSVAFIFRILFDGIFGLIGYQVIYI